jgi:hypothetical protein
MKMRIDCNYYYYYLTILHDDLLVRLMVDHRWLDLLNIHRELMIEDVEMNNVDEKHWLFSYVFSI